MRPIVWTKYGPPHVLQLQEVEKPVPKDHEVLISIYATTVTILPGWDTILPGWGTILSRWDTNGHQWTPMDTKMASWVVMVKR